MSYRPSHNLDGLDVELTRRIDAVCRRFEADWRAGRRPRIENYLGEVLEEGRPALRAELIALERELRQVDGTIARSEPGPIAEARTIAPASPPTAPIADRAEDVLLPFLCGIIFHRRFRKYAAIGGRWERRLRRSTGRRQCLDHRHPLDYCGWSSQDTIEDVSFAVSRLGLPALVAPRGERPQGGPSG
jgi:hypothetical protein